MVDGGRGRPRSPQAHQAILAATCDLLLQTGYDGLSIEGVAARAGVGKQTVYRWWPSKSALVTEAVLEGRLAINGELPPDTGDLRNDLHTWLARQFEALADPYVLSLIRAVTAAAADDNAAGAALYERFTGISRAGTIRRRPPLGRRRRCRHPALRRAHPAGPAPPATNHRTARHAHGRYRPIGRRQEARPGSGHRSTVTRARRP